MGFYKTQKELKFIKSHLNENFFEILDLGGGSGRFALPLQEIGLDVTLVDFNLNAIEIAKQREIKKALCINIKEFKESNYDLVLL